MTSPTYERLRRDLITAMSQRDMVAVSAIRTAVAAIDNAGAVEAQHSAAPIGAGGFSPDVPRRELDEKAVAQILEAEIEERRTAMATLADLGQDSHVERLQREVEVLVRYLAE
ncbi:MAG TPA: hypothetical protein VF377_16475 [Acidimicrobiia bacterium]|jgi:uncharacterized protein YqeY